jgi:hypothetical protein
MSEPCKNQDGAVMIMIIISMVMASIVGVAMVELTTTATYGQLSTNHQDRAYYLAESGGRYALPLVVDDVVNGVTTNIDLLHNITYTLDNGSITDGGDAADFILYQCEDQDFKIKNNAIINGGLYAPLTDKIAIEGQAHVTGSVVADKVSMKNDSQITYDTSLSDFLIPGGSSFLGDLIQYYAS